MSITVPSTFDTSDLTLPGGIGAGEGVANASQVVLSNNHNFVGFNYRPSLGEICNGETSSYSQIATGVSWANVCSVPVRAEATGRGVVFTGYFKNLESDPAEFRISCGNQTGTAVTVAASTTTWTEKTLVCDSPAGSDFLAVLQFNNQASIGSPGNLRVASGSFAWQGKTGSQSAAPHTNGFIPCDVAEVATHFPLSVEYVNRLLGAPRTIYDATPKVMACFSSNLNTNRITTTSTTYAADPVLYLILPKRRANVKIRFQCVGLNGTIRVVHGVGSPDYVEWAMGGGIAAWNTAGPYTGATESGTVDLSTAEEFTIAQVFIKANASTTASLQALSAFVVG